MGFVGILLYPIGIPLWTAGVLIKDGIMEVSRTKIQHETQKEIILQAVLESVVPWDPTWKIQDGFQFDDLEDKQLSLIHSAFVEKEEASFLTPRGVAREPDSREVMETALMDWADNEGAQKINVGEVAFMAYDDATFELTEAQQLERTLVKRHGLIFSSYHTGAPFFELFEMFRKLVLTSILQFVAPGSATQLTFATLVNFIALCVSFNWSPFLDNSVDAFNQVGCSRLISVDPRSHLKRA